MRLRYAINIYVRLYRQYINILLCRLAAFYTSVNGLGFSLVTQQTHGNQMDLLVIYMERRDQLASDTTGMPEKSCRIHIRDANTPALAVNRINNNNCSKTIIVIRKKHNRVIKTYIHFLVFPPLSQRKTLTHCQSICQLTLLQRK